MKRLFSLFIKSALVIIFIGIILWIEKINDNLENNSLIIKTDKTEYKIGEEINITIQNDLKEDIYYYKNGDRFWNIEYQIDGKWINQSMEEKGGFQLVNNDIGENCIIAVYEQAAPERMASKTKISTKWNQKICPFGIEDNSKFRKIRYFGSGQYRLIFEYDYEISTNDPYKVKDVKTIYSNVFSIK